MTDRLNELRAEANIHGVLDIDQAEELFRLVEVSAAQQLAEALRLTVEYVGTATLPALPGWSWYDALTAHYPAMAEELSKPQYRGQPAGQESTRATTEAELDGLPLFAMVQGYDGFHHVKLLNGQWLLIVEGSSAPHGTHEIALPATILHAPEGNK